MRWNPWFKVLPYPQASFSSRPVTIAPHILPSMHFLPGLHHSSIPGQIVWSRASCKLTCHPLAPHFSCPSSPPVWHMMEYSYCSTIPVSWETQPLIEPENAQHWTVVLVRLLECLPPPLWLSFHPYKSPGKCHVQNGRRTVLLLPKSQLKKADFAIL